MFNTTTTQHILTTLADIPVSSCHLDTCGAICKLRKGEGHTITWEEASALAVDMARVSISTVSVYPNGVVFSNGPTKVMEIPHNINVHVALDGAMCDVYDAMPTLQEAMEAGELVDVQ